MRFQVVSSVDLDMQSAPRTHVVELWDEMSQLGHDVTLFVLKSGKSGGKIGRMRVVGGKFLPVPRLEDATYQFWLLLALAWDALLRRPSVIYVRNGTLDFAPHLVGSLFRVPVVIEVNGMTLEEMERCWHTPRVKVVLSRWLERWKLARADAVITVTPQIKQVVESKYYLRRPAIVIPNAVNTRVFRPMDQLECCKKLGLPDDARYVVFVGFAAPWQRMDVVIEASPAVVARIPDVKFLVVGDGPQRLEWETLVAKLELSDRFVFAGAVPHSAVPEYMGCGDVAVLPKSEMSSGYSPLKLYEYMASSLPVVASRVPGLEVLTEHGAGMLVETEDRGAWAEAITGLLLDDELRSEMGKRGRQMATARYSWGRAAKATLEFIETIRDSPGWVQSASPVVDAESGRQE